MFAALMLCLVASAFADECDTEITTTTEPTESTEPIEVTESTELEDTQDWQFRLEYNDNSTFCSAVLISKSWVITAAHCVYGASPKEFTLTSVDTYYRDRHKVNKIYIHPDYNNNTFDYDVALLKLSSPVVLSVNDYYDDVKHPEKVFSSIRLPVVDKQIPIGIEGILTGYGKNDTHIGTDLLYKHVKVISKKECQSKYSLQNITLPEPTFCTSSEDLEEDCIENVSDTGGPLVINDDVAGISIFTSCGYEDYPDVHVDVGKVLPFIVNTTGITLRRIIAGGPTNISQVPYQVALEWYGRQICGGSIIAKEWVVTAAHCTDGSTTDELRVRSGSSLIEEGGVLSDVTKLYQHPRYYDVHTDITVLKVSPSFVWSDSVAPIALPQPYVVPAAGTLALASGWGSLDNEGTIYATHVHSLIVPITDHAKCKAAYARSKIPITKTMICASMGEGGKDTCYGDSGGPLAVNGVLIGVVSFGVGCANVKFPTVYTNVPVLVRYVTKVSGVQSA